MYRLNSPTYLRYSMGTHTYRQHCSRMHCLKWRSSAFFMHGENAHQLRTQQSRLVLYFLRYGGEGSSTCRCLGGDHHHLPALPVERSYGMRTGQVSQGSNDELSPDVPLHSITAPLFLNPSCTVGNISTIESRKYGKFLMQATKPACYGHTLLLRGDEGQST